MSKKGEVPKAFIVTKERKELNLDAFREFLKEHLAHFKIPHHFEFVKNYLKTEPGKRVGWNDLLEHINYELFCGAVLR